MNRTAIMAAKHLTKEHKKKSFLTTYSKNPGVETS